jgi:hypothetical protein
MPGIIIYGKTIMNIKENISRANTKLNFLLPETPIYQRSLTRFQTFFLFILCGVIFFVVGLLIPANGFIAFDWVHVFALSKIPPFYPPWD